MSEVAFAFEDVARTVRRAHSAATIEDAEEAVQTAVAEGLEKGWELTAANVVACARFRLLSAFERGHRKREVASLDEPARPGCAPLELAVDDGGWDGREALIDIARNPVLARRQAVLEAGGLMFGPHRGTAHAKARHSDELVEQARRLRREGLTNSEISKKLGVALGTVANWLSGQTRRAPSEPGWTAELIVEAVRAWAREEGRRPALRDLRASDPRLPSCRRTITECGGWSRLLREAGFDLKPTRGATHG